VLLGDLVVDIDLEPDEPLRPKCGRCTACIDRCPTGALQPGYVVETPRCISYLTIECRGAIPHDLRSLIGRWVFGCDECQEVCPYTAAASMDQDDAFSAGALDNVYPRLGWLLTMTEAEFRETYRGTPVLRTKRAGMARNAAIALGNCGSASDLATLEQAVQTHDIALVRGHAAWAMGQLNRRAAEPFLARQFDREPDEYVRDEIAVSLQIPM
jgi:epoxyqueuosine reductase